MKEKLSFQTPKSFLLVFFTFLLLSPNVFANTVCGQIENLEFSNGHETAPLENNGVYNINDLPEHFYLDVNVHGYSQSAKYTVENLQTHQTYTIVENLLPYTFPAGNSAWDLGTGDFRIRVSIYKFDRAIVKCDTKTYTITISDEEPFCTADAGTLQATAGKVTLVGDGVEISATEDGNQVVPEGYSKIFVLTMGEALLIKGVNQEAPVFNVTEPGMYTIHTLVFDGRSDSPNFLDLGVVGPTTTGVDVLNIVIENGLCASLDVPGAPVYVEEADSCDVSAGTLTASAEEVCSTGEIVISAHPNNDAIIPNDYSVLYVLTQGEGLIIRQISETPEFTVVGGGHYTIHTFVFPTGVDLSGVVPNVTTGFDVNALLIQGGGELCAALDVAGAPISITNPNAGTLTAIDTNVALTGGVAMLSAQPNHDAIIPNDYSVLYVLTQGEELVIRQIENTPEFTVTEPGNYTIHTLVYPTGLDLSAVVPNVTTGFDVNSLLVQGGGELCASLDVAGAPIHVEAEECTAFSGKMYSPKSVVCLENGVASLYAKFNRNPNIPKGYKQLFVLTDAFTLTVLQVSEHPEFSVDGSGFYRIHSLVYNPDTLDLGVVKFGETTGFDVLNLIEENGICASLHVKGAINLVIGSKWFCYFFNKYRAKNNSNLTSKGTNDDDLESYVSAFDSYDEFEASFVEQNDEVRFYPNPVVNDLNVEIRLFDNEEIEYNIVDMKGRAIISGSAEDLKSGKLTINTDRFANGMYIVNFVSEMRTITKKIMIEK